MDTHHSPALDAIIINTDRYEGYKLAAKETTDKELKKLFTRFSLQSRRFINELKEFVGPEQVKYGSASHPFRLHTLQFDLRSRLSNKHRKAVLACFEYVEY